MDYRMKAHMGTDTVEALQVRYGNPLKMHKSLFERYLRARMDEPGVEAELIKLIEDWKAEARRINRERRAIKTVNRSDAKYHAEVV